MFFMVAIHHMKTFRDGEYPPYTILNLVESHHMVNIHHYLLYDCSCDGLPASEGPDTRVYGSNSNLWKLWWMYTIFVVLLFSRFISCSYSFWWSFLCFTEQQSWRWCPHSFWQAWPPWPSPWPPSTPPSSFFNKWRFFQPQAHAAAASLLKLGTAPVRRITRVQGNFKSFCPVWSGLWLIVLFLLCFFLFSYSACLIIWASGVLGVDIARGKASGRDAQAQAHRE